MPARFSGLMIITAIATATVIVGITFGVIVAANPVEPKDVYADYYLAMAQKSGRGVTAYDEYGNEIESEGPRSIVVADIISEQIVIQKGSFAKLQVSLSHAATSKGYDSLTVVMPGESMGSYILEESAVPKYSDEEIDEIMQSKRSIDGIYNTNDLVTYVPSLVVLKANETKTVEMIIKVPPTWPDSLNGRPVSIPFTFDISNRVSGIGTQDDAVNVTVS